MELLQWLGKIWKGYDDYPEKRLYFSFGEEISSVEDKLYEKDMVITYEKETINT